MLTNGRIWRLYWQGALSVAEDFLEIDLGKVLDLPGCDLDLLDRRPEVFTSNAAWRDHVFRLFVLLFGREAFLPQDAGQSFHDFALKEGSSGRRGSPGACLARCSIRSFRPSPTPCAELIVSGHRCCTRPISKR